MSVSVSTASVDGADVQVVGVDEESGVEGAGSFDRCLRGIG